MAKGLRSRVKKVNKQKLRSNVFGPVEEARKERLSAKLLELASNSYEKEKTTSDSVAKSKITTHSPNLACHAENRLPGTTSTTTSTPGPAISRDKEGRSINQLIARAYAKRVHRPDVELDVPTISKIQNQNTAVRIAKRGRSKSKAAMVFPVFRLGKRVGLHLSSRQRKQNLKPR